MVAMQVFQYLIVMVAFDVSTPSTLQAVNVHSLQVRAFSASSLSLTCSRLQILNSPCTLFDDPYSRIRKPLSRPTTDTRNACKSTNGPTSIGHSSTCCARYSTSANGTTGWLNSATF